MSRRSPAPHAAELVLAEDPYAAHALVRATEDRAAARAAREGAVAAGVPALILAAGAVALGPALHGAVSAMLMTALPAMVAAAVSDVVAVGMAAAVALPLAAWAGRTSRAHAAQGPRAARAAAAGAGMATTAVAAGALAVHAGGLVGLLHLSTSVIAAVTASGVVGALATRAAALDLPGTDAAPAAYTAFGAAGATACTLMVAGGVMDHLALAFPLLDAPRMALYQALPHPLSDLASIAIVLATLAPVTWFTLAALGDRVRPESRGPLMAGAALTALSPALSCVAIAMATLFVSPHVAANHLALAMGALLGALPHLAAGVVALRPRRRRLTAGE